MSNADKVLCQTPTPGKQPTRIDRWKYDLVHSAILAVVPSNDHGIEFRELPALVEQQLDPGEKEKLGSVSWYTTTVKLDMEVRRAIERVPGSKPQRLRSTGKIFNYRSQLESNNLAISSRAGYGSSSCFPCLSTQTCAFPLSTLPISEHGIPSASIARQI